jgi:hypothetical protein
MRVRVHVRRSATTQRYTRGATVLLNHARARSDTHGTAALVLLGDGSWSCSSDRNVERDFAPVPLQWILDKIAGLLIRTWSYKSDRSRARHIGPTAQDFKAAFKVGNDSRSIGLLDENGVALAGVQGLYRLAQRQQAQIATLQAQMRNLETSTATRHGG